MKQLNFSLAFIFATLGFATQLFCPQIVFAEKQISVGGFVAQIQTVNCTYFPMIDFSKAGHNVTLAECTINNNLPEFEVNFRLTPALDREDETIRFTSISLHEVGGKRGQGISNPTGKNLLSTSSQGEQGMITWKPESQNDATVNYGVEIKASWVAPKLTHRLHLPSLTQRHIASI